MVFVIAALSSFNNPYYLLTAALIVGGCVSVYFALEGLSRQGGLLNSWTSTLLCMITGLVLLYYGFSSIIDFYNGHHQTMDHFVGRVDEIARFFR